MSPAIANTRTSVGVSTSQRYKEEEEGEHGVGGGRKVEGWLWMSKTLALYSRKNVRAGLNLCWLVPSIHAPSQLFEGHANVVFEGASSAQTKGLGIHSPAPIMASSGTLFFPYECKALSVVLVDRDAAQAPQ